MKLVYFAWVRERVGHPDEIVEPPPDIRTVAELVAWLKARDERYGRAFENEATVRAAVDRVHAKPGTSIEGAREVAFFRPMTGG